jgi:hypothetical protein
MSPEYFSFSVIIAEILRFIFILVNMSDIFTNRQKSLLFPLKLWKCYKKVTDPEHWRRAVLEFT